jgi:hypothetical protein
MYSKSRILCHLNYSQELKEEECKWVADCRIYCMTWRGRKAIVKCPKHHTTAEYNVYDRNVAMQN